MSKLQLLTFIPLLMLTAAFPAYGGYFLDNPIDGNFTGNSANTVQAGSLTPAPRGDSLINFAVFNNQVHTNWANQLGVTANATAINDFGAPDTSASFVYFYQLVNTDQDNSLL